MESNTLARWAASNPPKIQGGFVISKRYHWPRDMNWIAEQSKEAKSKHLGWSWQAMAWWCSYQYICGYILIYRYIYHMWTKLMNTWCSFRCWIYWCKIIHWWRHKYRFSSHIVCMGQTFNTAAKIHILILFSFSLVYFWPLWQNAHSAKMHICALGEGA